MTNAEVIEALQNCANVNYEYRAGDASCSKCPYNKISYCKRTMMRAAADAIKTFACSDCCPNEYMYDCARAILIVKREGCGDCMLAEDFLEAVESGGFLPYDGEGYFCDEDGNDLGDVWSTKTVPAETKFVMWFNK